MSDRTRRSEINRSSGTERTASTGRLGPYESQYEISMGYGSDRSITVR